MDGSIHLPTDEDFCHAQEQQRLVLLLSPPRGPRERTGPFATGKTTEKEGEDDMEDGSSCHEEGGEEEGRGKSRPKEGTVLLPLGRTGPRGRAPSLPRGTGIPAPPPPPGRQKERQLWPSLTRVMTPVLFWRIRACLWVFLRAPCHKIEAPNRSLRDFQPSLRQWAGNLLPLSG